MRGGVTATRKSHDLEFRFKSGLATKMNKANKLSSKARKRIHRSLRRRDGAICVFCLREESESVILSIDHIIIKSNGGSNKLENLRLLCLECHVMRHLKDGVNKARDTLRYP